MHWFTLAILAAISWALVNNLDKIIITRFIKSPLGIVVIEGLVGFLVSLFFLQSIDLSKVPLTIALFCILAGLLLYVFNYLYYRALADSDPTVVAILMQTVPLFTFVWGYLYFSESFTIPVYIGAVLIIGGSILATLEKHSANTGDLKGGHKHIRTALLIMIPANILLSLNYAIQKYAFQYTDDKTVFFLGRVGGLFFALFFLLVPAVRKSIQEFLSIKKLKEWSFFLFIELFNLAGIFLVTIAYSLGPISLVTTVTSIQPVFVAIIGILIGIVFLGQRSALSTGLGGYRIPSIILITAGVYLLNI
jgi:drug/metabolite transporter (DMT)-like permease